MGTTATSTAPGGGGEHKIDNELGNAVRRASFQREIRKVENRPEEQQKLHNKQAELATYKEDLLLKVKEHMMEIDNKQKQRHTAEEISKFKNELLEKVDEHMKELERSNTKRDDVAKFKTEMLTRVEAFQRH